MNAVKYSPLEGVIFVELSQQDNEAKLTIADAGPGIETEKLLDYLSVLLEPKAIIKQQRGLA